MQLFFEGGAGYHTKNLDFRDGFGCVLLVGEARVLLMGEDSFGSVFVCKGEDKFRALDSRLMDYGLGTGHINRNFHETGAHPKTHNMVPEAKTPRTHPCLHEHTRVHKTRFNPKASALHLNWARRAPRSAQDHREGAGFSAAARTRHARRAHREVVFSRFGVEEV